MHQQFKWSARLHQSKDFTRIFRTGRRFKRYCLLVHVAPKPSNLSSEEKINTESPPASFNESRVGIVIPKKAVSLATRRHRLKRIIRESFRLNQAHLVNLDIVILMMRGIPYNEKRLWQTLEQIWLELREPFNLS